MPQIKVFDEVPVSSIKMNLIDEPFESKDYEFVSIKVNIMTIPEIPKPQVQQPLLLDQPPDEHKLSFLFTLPGVDTLMVYSDEYEYPAGQLEINFEHIFEFELTLRLCESLKKGFKIGLISHHYVPIKSENIEEIKGMIPIELDKSKKSPQGKKEMPPKKDVNLKKGNSLSEQWCKCKFSSTEIGFGTFQLTDSFSSHDPVRGEINIKTADFSVGISLIWTFE